MTVEVRTSDSGFPQTFSNVTGLAVTGDTLMIMYADSQGNNINVIDDFGYSVTVLK